MAVRGGPFTPTRGTFKHVTFRSYRQYRNALEIAHGRAGSLSEAQRAGRWVNTGPGDVARSYGDWLVLGRAVTRREKGGYAPPGSWRSSEKLRDNALGQLMRQLLSYPEGAVMQFGIAGLYVDDPFGSDPKHSQKWLSELVTREEAIRSVAAVKRVEELSAERRGEHNATLEVFGFSLRQVQ